HDVSKTLLPPLSVSLLSIFEVKEISHGRAGTGRGVWLADLPLWKPFPDNVSSVLIRYSVVLYDRTKRRQLL
ncbi:hypothetical protein EMPG_11790, partial [Blastomyces silverae]